MDKEHMALTVEKGMAMVVTNITEYLEKAKNL